MKIPTLRHRAAPPANDHRDNRLARRGWAVVWRTLCVVLLGSSLASACRAADAATAKITGLAANGGLHYTVVLTNTGTNNLGTFWYAWQPGQDFMPVSPTAIQSPTGWTATITGGNPNNGYGIQWRTSAATPAPLSPGASLSFGFDSTASPDTLAGKSPFYATTPIGHSVVYGGAPFSDAGFTFDVVSDLFPFFDDETNLGNGVYYLALSNGNIFGYYSYLEDPHYIYHFDLGYEYLFDALNQDHGVYFYDFTSQGFFYTSPGLPFPYLYDFSRQAVLYLYPNPTDPSHYGTNGVRYFYDFSAGKIISK